MINPKQIQVIKEGATYQVPTYKITNNGIEDGTGMTIKLAKGNKANEADFRQEGLFTETLIQVAKEYLEYVNKGELKSTETSMAIIKLEESLFWLNKRAEDRKLRSVQATYNK